MDWTRTNLLRAPSSNFQPDELPVSWVAACILTHIRTTYWQRTSIGMARILELPNGLFLQVDSLEVASALYTGLERLACDCYPNTHWSFSRNGCAEKYAWRPIKAGEEITTSFFGDCIGTSREERAICFAQVLGAPCKCQACFENWPTIAAQTLQPSAFFMCKICSRPIPTYERSQSSQLCQCSDVIKSARASECIETVKLHNEVFQRLEAPSISNQSKDLDRSFEAVVALLEKEDTIFPRDSRIHMETLIKLKMYLEMSKAYRRIIPQAKISFEPN